MSAIVPYHRAELKRGATNVVQFAAGGVAADVRIERVDRRNRCSWYALRLASTDADVTGRLFGRLHDDEIVDLGGVAVAPGSIGGAHFAVTTPRTGAYKSMFLEIRSDGVLLRLDAPKPPGPRRGRVLRTAALLFGGSAAALAVAAVTLTLPGRPTLAAPARGIAGTRAFISYAVSGKGSIDYAAAFDDGVVLAAAPLAASSGEIGIALPAGSARRSVSVTVTAHGPLGALARTVSIPVVAPDPVVANAAVARVLSFAARRDPAPGGETVLASYLAVGERGTVLLRDPSGAVVASAPFAHVGTTRLPVPAAARALPLFAEITVHRGSTRAVASVAVPPNAAPAAPGAQPATSVAEADAPEAVTPIDSTTARGGDGIIVVNGRAVGGKPLLLRVLANAAPMRVELQDEAGGTIAETEIAAGSTTATLPLPPAQTRTTYFVALHYARNGGEETVVRTVVAAPR